MLSCVMTGLGPVGCHQRLCNNCALRSKQAICLLIRDLWHFPPQDRFRQVSICLWIRIKRYLFARYATWKNGAKRILPSSRWHKGGWCQARVLSIRLIAAVWCLGCFVLIQSYSSTLFSHVLSPSIHPVINSINDFPNVPDLLVTVDRGRSIETAILVNQHIKYG